MIEGGDFTKGQTKYTTNEYFELQDSQSSWFTAPMTSSKKILIVISLNTKGNSSTQCLYIEYKDFL